MTGSMRTGGLTPNQRRTDRAVEQLRAEVARLRAMVESKAAADELEALQAQVGKIQDNDGDGLPDALIVDGGSA